MDVDFYINRAGKNLAEERVAVLEHAKELLSEVIAKEKDNLPAKKAAVGKYPAKRAAKKFATKH